MQQLAGHRSVPLLHFLYYPVAVQRHRCRAAATTESKHLVHILFSLPLCQRHMACWGGWVSLGVGPRSVPGGGGLRAIYTQAGH